MDQPPCGISIHDGSGGTRAGSQDSPQGWVCPMFLSDPIRHYACMGFKLGRVADVRQHLKRKHPEEAKKMGKTGERKTNKERWDALWDDLFPGQTRPAMPYAGTKVVGLFGTVVTEYIEQRREEMLLVDGQTALMQFLAYVEVRSLGMWPGNVSGQDITEVSEHQTQGNGVQHHTHQHVPLSANLSEPIMGSFEQPDPLALASHCNAPTSGATFEPQVLSNLEANGQSWAFPANSDAYSSTLTHQLPPNQWAGIGLGNNESGNSLVASFGLTSATDGDWTENLPHDGRGASWDISQVSEAGSNILWK